MRVIASPLQKAPKPSPCCTVLCQVDLHEAAGPKQLQMLNRLQPRASLCLISLIGARRRPSVALSSRAPSPCSPTKPSGPALPTRRPCAAAQGVSEAARSTQRP